MLPSADQLFKDADFIFQQDLAPAQTAKSIKSWLNDHGVGVLDWPANSPEILRYGNSFPPTFPEVLLAHASPNDWPIVAKHANNDELEAV